MRFFKPAEGRIWQLDFARGAAVLMMILFHFLFDLNYFAGYAILLSSGFWLVFARATLAIMLLLVGISLSLSYSRTRGVMNGKEMVMKYARRGLRIFAYGLAITAVTFIFFPGSAIWFGVLHMIGLSIMLAVPLLPRRRLALALGLVFILLGYFLSQTSFSFPWLLWLGFFPEGFYTFDYVPLLPWFGVVLLGLYAGRSLPRRMKPAPRRAASAAGVRTASAAGRRTASAAGMARMPSAAVPLCFAGRHSLFIYLLHQPVLVGVLLAALSF